MTMNGKKTPLAVATNYDPPDDFRVSNLWSSGELRQSVEGENWEVQ